MTLNFEKKDLLKLMDFLISVIFIPGLFYLVHYFDWNAGTRRGLILLVLLGLSYLTNRYTFKKEEALVSKKIILFLAGILLLFNIVYLIKNINAIPIDIGTTTKTAVDVFWKSGLNPYASPVDPLPETALFPDFFLEGYKYFPATLIIYSPLVLLFGMKGIFFTNFIFYILALFLILKIGDLIYKNPGTNYVAAILFLSSFLITSQLFKYGVNDILPIFFILVSYYFFLKDNEKLSGLFLGLSIATVWLPGILFLAVLIPSVKNKERFLFSTLGVVSLFLLPFLFWNYRSLIESDFIMLLCRGADSTSFLFELPQIISLPIKFLIFLGLIFFLKRNYELPTKNKYEVIFRYIIIMILVSLAQKWGHRNYQIWIIPFFSLWLASFRFKILGFLKKT